MLVSPMLYNDQLIGLITLINKSKEKAFTYSQMVLLSGVSAHLASALKNLEKEEEDHLRERLTQQKVYY
jgi:GAF domain-containing protein